MSSCKRRFLQSCWSEGYGCRSLVWGWAKHPLIFACMVHRHSKCCFSLQNTGKKWRDALAFSLALIWYTDRLLLIGTFAIWTIPKHRYFSQDFCSMNTWRSCAQPHLQVACSVLCSVVCICTNFKEASRHPVGSSKKKKKALHLCN